MLLLFIVYWKNIKMEWFKYCPVCLNNDFRASHITLSEEYIISCTLCGARTDYFELLDELLLH